MEVTINVIRMKCKQSLEHLISIIKRLVFFIVWVYVYRLGIEAKKNWANELWRFELFVCHLCPIIRSFFVNEVNEVNVHDY